MGKLGARFDEPRGQTMAEYGVVLALITLVVAASLTVLSDSLIAAFSAVAEIFA
jgi:Flp pilus assembly pilin Flp